MDDNIQIIKNDEIDLRALYQVLWSDRKLIVMITGFITFIGILYVIMATPLQKMVLK